MEGILTFKTDVGIVGEVNNGWISQPTLKKEEKEGLADYLNDDLLFVGKIGVCHWLRMNCVADLKMMGEAVKVDLNTNENKPLYLSMTSDEEMRHYRRLTELIGEEKVNKLKNAIRERIIWER